MSVLDKFKSNKLVKENTFVDRPLEYISTGSATLNIMFSGKINGGIVKNRVMQICTDSAYGKSIIAMMTAKNAQKQGMDILLVDTEYAYDASTAKKFGLDEDKLLVIQSNSIEDVQHMILSSTSEMTQKEKDNLVIVIDSWGNLVTSKSTEDIIAGKDVRDMTKAQKKNEFARQLCGLKSTVFVVNQIYACGTELMEVITPSGTKTLKDLTVGDIVLTTNGYESVQSKVEYEDAVINQIELENGEILEFTNEHKFQVIRDGVVQWVTVGDLREGESLITI